jgi:hypothetical protein
MLSVWQQGVDVQADPRLLEDVVGLQPDQEKHQFQIDILPVGGSTVLSILPVGGSTVLKHPSGRWLYFTFASSR